MSKELKKNLRVIFGVVVLFMINKFLLRPYVLASDFPEAVNIFVLSFPNFCEAICGSLLLANIGLSLKSRFTWALKNKHIYFASTLFAAVYVLTQEMKIHNLGGRNVYDPFDLLFSVIGLLIAAVILGNVKQVGPMP